MPFGAASSDLDYLSKTNPPPTLKPLGFHDTPATTLTPDGTEKSGYLYLAEVKAAGAGASEMAIALAAMEFQRDVVLRPTHQKPAEQLVGLVQIISESY